MSDSIKTVTIHCKQNQSILDVCREQGIFVDGVCSGRGICGKCKIKVIEGVVPVTSKDNAFFSKKELAEGYRLACMAHPLTPCRIEVDNSNADMQIVVEERQKDLNDNKTASEEDFLHTATANSGSAEGSQYIKDGKYAILVDIGTTTLAMQLVYYKPENEGEFSNAYHIIDTYGAVNGQRSFGADVISRIQASVQGQSEKLKKTIRKNLAEGISKLLINKIDTIVIAGNTTMIHLLMGYSCETLGVAPFVPVTTQSIKEKAELFFADYMNKDILDQLKGVKLTILPGISAFVGADIVSGLYETGLADSEEVEMFVDLGTNAEMAIGSNKGILVTSAAAGPALEGGNIACGMASVKGAICNAKLREDGAWEIKTIDNGEPVGICGTGVIEIISELFRTGKIDETGLLDDGETEEIVLYEKLESEEDIFSAPFSQSAVTEKKKVYITQQDIRALQLAKGAICAGVETLIKEYGITANKVKRVYVAGGFGYYLDIEKAVRAGLFPKELGAKIVPVGNSALAGIKKFVTHKDAGNQLERICKMVKEVNLAENEYFKDAYLEHMYFKNY